MQKFASFLTNYFNFCLIFKNTQQEVTSFSGYGSQDLGNKFFFRKFPVYILFLEILSQNLALFEYSAEFKPFWLPLPWLDNVFGGGGGGGGAAPPPPAPDGGGTDGAPAPPAPEEEEAPAE